MKQQDSARFLTNYEISDILQHIATVVNSNPQKNDYLNNGETYTAVEGHTIGFIKDHPGCTATEIACEWGKTTSLGTRPSKTGIPTKHRSSCWNV